MSLELYSTCFLLSKDKDYVSRKGMVLLLHRIRRMQETSGGGWKQFSQQTNFESICIPCLNFQCEIWIDISHSPPKAKDHTLCVLSSSESSRCLVASSTFDTLSRKVTSNVEDAVRHRDDSLEERTQGVWSLV
ncbi:hypothetical protein DY000_02030287 [Brassica cretica]|uniref:Uncharacterized protein n=1 Tax=Brassica cretica TaxID=69181 RepID=A0ABQ7DTA1_BRACR|nr:hypothetical protein DY000_02030287 [Brassica cretica]